MKRPWPGLAWPQMAMPAGTVLNTAVQGGV